MASFQFRALQPDGGVAEGTLEAPDRREALRLIAARGLRPVKLSDSASSATGYAPAARSTPQVSGKPSPSTGNGAPASSNGTRTTGSTPARVATRPASRSAVRQIGRAHV